MIIYILITTILTFLTILDIIKVNLDVKRSFFLAAYIILCMFAGLRYEIGADYLPYTEIYNDVGYFWDILAGTSNYTDIHGELGYLVYNSIVKSIFDDVNFLFLSIAFLSMGLTFYSICRYSPFIFLSIFLYYCRFFYLRDMGQIRTAVASAIILLCIESIAKRRFWRFVGLLILATLFHNTALIMLPIYFICGCTWKNSSYYLSLILSVIIAIMVPLKEIIQIYFGAVNINVLMMYIFSEYGEPLGVLNPVAIMQGMLLCISIYYRSILDKKVFAFNVILTIYAVSTYWLLIFNDLGIIAGRVANVLASVEILIIPSLLLISNQRSNKFFLYLAILLYGLVYLFFRFSYTELYELLVPYKSIFEH